MTVFNKRRAIVRKASGKKQEIIGLVTDSPSYIHKETLADRQHKATIERYRDVARGVGFHKHDGSKSARQLAIHNYKYVSDQFK